MCDFESSKFQHIKRTACDGSKCLRKKKFECKISATQHLRKIQGLKRAKQRRYSMSDGSEIIIKKYPNRRLYDTRSSVYITLEDVKRLVEEKKKVKVIDVKSSEDLTRSTLMQILLEEEAGGAPIFTSEMLAEVISFYGHAQRTALGPFLEISLKAYVKGAEEMVKQAAAVKEGTQKQADAILGANAKAWTDLAAAQQDAVAGMLEQMQKAWLPKS
jgi:polyhydroxyalkanoate synthesis repressor PhaR